jgi:hypothetical protein
MDNPVMDCYFDPSVPKTLPLLSKGPGMPQARGSEIRFRNISMRKIPAAGAGQKR